MSPNAALPQVMHWAVSKDNSSVDVLLQSPTTGIGGGVAGTSLTFSRERESENVCICLCVTDSDLGFSFGRLGSARVQPELDDDHLQCRRRLHDGHTDLYDHSEERLDGLHQHHVAQHHERSLDEVSGVYVCLSVSVWFLVGLCGSVGLSPSKTYTYTHTYARTHNFWHTLLFVFLTQGRQHDVSVVHVPSLACLTGQRERHGVLGRSLRHVGPALCSNCMVLDSRLSCCHQSVQPVEQHKVHVHGAAEPGDSAGCALEGVCGQLDHRRDAAVADTGYALRLVSVILGRLRVSLLYWRVVFVGTRVASFF